MHISNITNKAIDIVPPDDLYDWIQQNELLQSRAPVDVYILHVTSHTTVYLEIV